MPFHPINQAGDIFLAAHANEVAALIPKAKAKLASVVRQVGLNIVKRRLNDNEVPTDPKFKYLKTALKVCTKKLSVVRAFSSGSSSYLWKGKL